MAQDRFVHFRKDVNPTKEDLEKLLKGYLEGLNAQVEWSRDRFYVTLPGEYTWPFKYLLPEEPLAKVHEKTDSKERWFEVYLKEVDYIDVITRQADELTNIIAQGFYKICRRYWGKIIS